MKSLFSKRLLGVPFLVILLSVSIISIFPNTAFAHVHAAPGFGFSINPTQGAPGTVVTASGSSWTQGETVDISLSPSTTILVSVTASLSEGMFTATFTVPANTAPGQQFVNADGRTGNETAQAPFTVLSSPAPTPTVDLQTLNIQSLQPLLANTSPTLRAYIRNNGSAASGFFGIQWIVDGQNLYGGHYSIPAGGVDTHDHIWNNITPGKHTITFIANFDHGVPETDYRNNQFTLAFTVAPPTSKPGGMWVYPDNGFTFIKGNTYTIVVQAYPSLPAAPAIDHVNITAYWSNAWHVICRVPNNRPDLGDYYYCSTNFLVNRKYPPAGKLTLSFDVYDMANNKNLSPNGTHTGMFSTTATNLSLAENNLDQKVKTVLATSNQQPSNKGDMLEQVRLSVECAADAIIPDLGTLFGSTRTFKIVDTIHELYGNAGTASTVAVVIKDNKTGQYGEGVIEVVKSMIPFSSCADIPQVVVPIMQTLSSGGLPILIIAVPLLIP